MIKSHLLEIRSLRIVTLEDNAFVEIKWNMKDNIFQKIINIAILILAHTVL